jgi:peptidoglycan/LPS O-acetylase OafA/YrhL
MLARGKPLDAKFLELTTYMVTFTFNLFGFEQLAIKQGMPLAGFGTHYWSIGVEEQFYLIAPFVLLFLGRKMRVWVVVVVLVANLWFSTPFATISVGVALAMSQERWGAWFITPGFRWGLFLVLPLGWIAVQAGWTTYSQVVPYVAGAIVALAAVPGPGSALGRALGGASYPLYLNHWLGLWVAGSLQKATGVALLTANIIGFAVVLLLSAVHERWVDRPIARLRASLFTEARGKACFVLAVCLLAAGLITGACALSA